MPRRTVLYGSFPLNAANIRSLPRMTVRCRSFPLKSALCRWMPATPAHFRTIRALPLISARKWPFWATIRVGETRVGELYDVGKCLSRLLYQMECTVLAPTSQSWRPHAHCIYVHTNRLIVEAVYECMCVCVNLCRCRPRNLAALELLPHQDLEIESPLVANVACRYPTLF